MQVVGFAGVARVGKSWSTNALKEEAERRGWKVFIVPFAKPLKDEAERLGFGKDKDPKAYREYCQNTGAAKRAEDANHWLDKWYMLIREVQKEEHKDDSGTPYLVLSDDVRYENELGAIRKSGGVSVYLEPGDRVLDAASATWRKHESEAMANSVLGNRDVFQHMFDFFVLNKGEGHNLKPWAARFFKDVVSCPGDLKDRCDCEGCQAALENRPVDTNKLNAELDDLLNEIDKKVNGDEDDDEDA